MIALISAKPMIEGAQDQVILWVNELLPFIGLLLGILIAVGIIMYLAGGDKSEVSAFEKALVADHNAEQEELAEDDFMAGEGGWDDGEGMI